jgi:hypothetical protein
VASRLKPRVIVDSSPVIKSYEYSSLDLLTYNPTRLSEERTKLRVMLVGSSAALALA